ncbi:MAG: hypothetical protein IT281_10085 [Ignavibacteria bacterium]|nr:hypothetical protein [Ignavibacteria bacterium]
MTIFLNRQHNYLFFLTISCYLCLFTNANNDTDHHSNETIEEYTTTFISLTTPGNITDDTIVIDDNKNTSIEIVNVVLSTISTPLEITDVSVIELNATLQNDINNLTAITTQINEIQVDTEKIEEQQTTMVSNISCDLSKSGCFSAGKNDTNSEGSNDETVNDISILNSTTTLNNDTESISTMKNDDMAVTTEKIEVSSETPKENITSVIIDENVSTESTMHDTTAAASVDDSKEVIESITTEKVESITTDKVENATTEQFESVATTEIESLTTQAIQTTTQTSTTTVRSTLCVDQDFECCPDGKTYAKVK